MNNQDDSNSTDDTSFKPVSSLRSLFENKSTPGKLPAPTQLTSRTPSPHINPVRRDGIQDDSHQDGRLSLDLPRLASRRTSPARNDYVSTKPVGIARAAPKPPPSRSPSRPRPMSMDTLSPPRSPLKVTVEAPRSPPHAQHGRPISPFALHEAANKPSQRQARTGQSLLGLETAHSYAPSGQSSARTAPPSASGVESATLPIPARSDSPVPRPPPVNRAGKPKIFSNGARPELISATLAPLPQNTKAEERTSPFSTPPDSDSGSPELEGASNTSRALEERHQTAMQSVGWTHPPMRPPRKGSVILPPPALEPSLRARSTRTYDAVGDRQITQKEIPTQAQHPVPAAANSEYTRGANNPRARDIPARESTDHNMHSASLPSTLGFTPPPKRSSTSAQSPTDVRSNAALAQPPRASIDTKRILREEKRSYTSESDLDPGGSIPHTSTGISVEYPDAAHSNRRLPIFMQPPHQIPTKYDTKLLAVCGEYVCTTGYLTRAWNICTGEVLLTLSHGDTVKMTSLAFKPASNAEDDGKRVWLGSSTGDILEVDIPSQSVAATRSNVHGRREVIRIYRHASNMWSLDEDGKLMIWNPDAEGTLNLSMTPRPFELGKGHTCSILAGNSMWFVCGKDIRIWQYDAQREALAPATPKPALPLGCGDITCGTLVSGRSKQLYFGHVDGKVSIFSRVDHSCLGIVSVSLYRISTLVGIGDYLWAGYNTGKIYVYDISAKPWTVKKDWNAHSDRIAAIVQDRTSLWKLDRLQVVSLGTDSCIKVWDGMLHEDWLEADMQLHDVDFCDFREITATVMTWNAGAAKPTWLRQEDARVMRELLSGSAGSPSLFVFGFQELVDLEKKSLTAKNFFKRSKKKDVMMDGSVQDHMSHQYRMWRDFLEQEVAHSTDESYVLLHTANLIGLFTCIFVKASERHCIRDVSATEIKLGMGGHYGNKGALVVRFVLEDSSICFINCHLAAGQTQTVSRNNDIATIMESNQLPQRVASTEVHGSDIFVGGGDGRMILDHEICILNGDLNYRIDTIPRDQIIAAAKQGNFSKLLERDQLLLSRKRNPGFRLRAFKESPLTFAPTYKYDVGTDTYDTSEKKRSPAWCDRIVYRGFGSIQQLDYRRHEIKVSDHRPVSARFKLRVKMIDAERRRKAWEQSKDRFEIVRQRIALNTKLDYLISVLGCSEQEAQRLLKK